MNLLKFSINQNLKRKVVLKKNFSTRVIFSQQKLLDLISINQLQKSYYSKKVIFQKSKKELDVPIPWGNIKVQIFGEASPKNKPILALHGFLDNSNSFMPLSNYLTKEGYYVIGVDLPGHGFSSHLPEGIQYTPRIVLTAVRRVANYFHLKNFTFLGHSYGAMMGMMYLACFPKEVQNAIFLDPILNPNREKRITDMAKLWGASIDEFISFEDNKGSKSTIEDSIEKGTRILTREIALEKLLKANRHLDKTAADILLDRALIVHDNKLEFSRDKRLRINVNPDHFIDWIVMSRTFSETIKCPIQFQYAFPPSYGEDNYRGSLDYFNTLKRNRPEIEVDVVKFEGSHHFHMIQPEKTCSNILQFLKNKKDNVNNTENVSS